MKDMNIYITSAFCKDGAGGNKAGIIFDHPELNKEEKMQLAKELGFSETVFVTRSEVADYKLEYYTPTEEVPLCGHATIAAFSTMYQGGTKNTTKYKECTIETRAGILKVSIADDGLVMMQQNKPEYYAWVDREELLPCLGNEISTEAKSRIISTGLKDIIVPFSSVEALHVAKPDFAKITELSKEKDVVGIHAFAIPAGNSKTDSVDSVDSVDAICRNFAPLYGIEEESATGTSSCALAGYLFRNGYKKEQYIFEQGHVLYQPSRIYVKIVEQEDDIAHIYVGGYGKVISVIDKG